MIHLFVVFPMLSSIYKTPRTAIHKYFNGFVKIGGPERLRASMRLFRHFHFAKVGIH